MYYITDYGVDKSADRLVALEDSIMQKEKPVTAGSKILSGFVSPFDATVVSRLEAGGYTIAGKTKMREFGLLPLCENEAELPYEVRNTQIDNEGTWSRGSKTEASGAVRAVADGAVTFALCNDFSGITRREACENGICYIHPTYGTVSRYGLIPAASSMDQIGVACKDAGEGFALLSVIAGKDEKDGAMFPEKSFEYKALDKRIKMLVPENVMAKAVPEDKAAVLELAKHFDAVSGELPYFGAFRQVQYILSCAEISANISRYDGIKFGCRTENYNSLEELYVNTRTEAFGPDAKLAAVMGSMVLSKERYKPYYEKALKLRRVIKESLSFEGYDVIVLPSRITGGIYENSAVYAPQTLAGLPGVSFPYGGGGVLMLAKVKNENALLTVLEAVSQ